MPAFQIVVDRRKKHATLFPFPSLHGHKGVVDLLVDGANLTARLGQAEVIPMLRDLGLAIGDLVAGRRSRAAISCLGGDEPWQLGVERCGGQALVSLFRTGASPEVAVHERRVAGHELLRGTLEAMEHAMAEAAPEEAAELRFMRETLAGCAWPREEEPEVASLRVAPEEDAPFSLSASLRLRTASRDEEREDSVERSDLLGLLFRGRLLLHLGEHSRDLGETYVYLVAERLLELASQVLEAWEHGRPFYRRLTVAGVTMAARHETGEGAKSKHERTIWLTFGGAREDKERNAQTFPNIEVPVFVRAAIDFAHALAEAIVAHDPSHRHNLRLSSLREVARELDERLGEATKDDAKVNPRAESYRAFAALSQRAQPSPTPTSPARLRFVPRWSADVPGIDLRATFLCGDRLIVGSARETACLDRASGHVLWQQPTSRAISVVTPAGLARIGIDGLVEVHDFGTGEITRSLRVAPRVGGSTAGAIVNAPGLPRLLVLTEGERHLSAIDLASFEVRFRHAARRGSSFRIRRAGRLLVIASGDPTLSALDVATGDVVWRVRDNLRFSTQAALDRDSLFALAGEPFVPTAARLHHLDPYAGTSHWVHELPKAVAPTGTILVAEDVVVVATRGPRGDGLVAIDRETGELRWTQEAAASPGSAWLVVDDLLVCNGVDGVVAAFEASTGKPRWRHSLRNPSEGDEPRRLEPILRSGALFVPQGAVHVIRPRDGEPLGAVPCDLVPDLLRVDENCAVYVAEESGHLAAFEAGARLSLVKG